MELIKLKIDIQITNMTGIALCNSEIEKLAERLESEIDMKVPITVPYSKFINSEKWKEYDPNSEKRVFSHIYDSHLRYLLFNSGLVSLANKSEFWKEQLLKKVLMTFLFFPLHSTSNYLFNYID
jgi:hypothetical protein